MIRALLNDVCQRVITFDKLDQRRYLRRRLIEMGLGNGHQALDFGCGTALFAREFKKLSINYVGYDIDAGLLAFNRMKYPWARFTSSLSSLDQGEAFDLILSNCCFHHVPDKDLDEILGWMASRLTGEGRLLIIDVFEEGPGKSALRHLLLKLERGAYFRRLDSYADSVRRFFDIIDLQICKCNLFPGQRGPTASSLVVYKCKARNN